MDPLELLVGTYTEQLAHVDGRADGILTVTIDPDGGSSVPRTLAPVRNPSWLTLGREGTLVVAVVETDDFDGRPTGGVASFRRDPLTGDLAPLGARSSGGGNPAFVVLDPTESFAIVANYGGGTVAVLPVASDGALGEPSDVASHSGWGPGTDAREPPHPHQVLLDPVTGEVLVVDLGADAIVRYRLDDGRLERTGIIELPPGSGPRHGVFSADGSVLAVATELDGSLLQLRRSADGFERNGGISLGNGVRPAAIRRHEPTGALLVSIRVADEVAIIRLGADGPSVTARFPCLGRTPRDILPIGDRLLVANQDSRDIVVLDLDVEAGRAEFVATVPVPSPVCLVQIER